MSNSLWHFPRKDFAERVMQSFLSGGSTALTLFALFSCQVDLGPIELIGVDRQPAIFVGI